MFVQSVTDFVLVTVMFALLLATALNVCILLNMCLKLPEFVALSSRDGAILSFLLA